jgi:hypothetical protein
MRMRKTNIAARAEGGNGVSRMKVFAKCGLLRRPKGNHRPGGGLGVRTFGNDNCTARRDR